MIVGRSRSAGLHDNLLWFDASNSANFSLSGTAIGQWNDLSGNNNHVSQSTAGAKPTYDNSINTINGLSVCSFDTNDVLANIGALSGFVGLNTNPGTSDVFTIVCIARDRGSANWGMCDLENGTTTNGIFNPFIQDNGVNYTLQVRYGGTGNEASKSVARSTVNPFLWSMIGGRKIRKAWINQSVGTTDTTDKGVQTVTPLNFRLGALFQDVFFGPADMGEFIMFQGQDDVKQAQLEAYMKLKWNV